ncbi:MAG: hypothetical protein VW235_11690, partial [Rhodospirillaceae bacterium]
MEIKKDLNENYNFVKNIIANPKELSKYVPENTDSKFINYLSKSHGDRIQKIDINIPEIGDTFKSEDVFVDMSTVNPKYIMGYVNNINPKAKKFKDLSLSEQELYKNNLLMQNAEIVSDFAKKAGGTAEEAEELREGISMGFDEVGRRKYKDGTPQQPESEEIDNLKKSFLKMKDELDSDKNPKSLIKSLETEMKDIAAFGQKYGGDVLGKVGKGITGVDLPIFQTMFASMYDIERDSPVWLTLPAAFTDEVSNIFNLYNKSEGTFGLGKVKDFGKFLASSLVPQKFLGKAIRSPLFKAVSKVGKATSMAAPLTETAVEAYRFKKMKDARDDAIRQFDIPIEIANKGFDDYIRSTIPKDAFDELNVPASPGLPKFKRGLQEFASMFGLADSPYEDPRG